MKSFHFALEWQTVLLLPVTISVWCHQHQRLIILVDKGKNAAITIETWMINVGFNMLPGPQTVFLLPKPSFTRLCCTDNGLCIRADHWPKCTLVTKFMLTLPPTTVLQCPYFATFIVHHHKHRGISRKINDRKIPVSYVVFQIGSWLQSKGPAIVLIQGPDFKVQLGTNGQMFAIRAKLGL